MESNWRPPTSSTRRTRRAAVRVAARGRARCWRLRKSVATARSGTDGGDIPPRPSLEPEIQGRQPKLRAAEDRGRLLRSISAVRAFGGIPPVAELNPAVAGAVPRTREIFVVRHLPAPRD